jgi:hypothetical protein
VWKGVVSGDGEGSGAGGENTGIEFEEGIRITLGSRAGLGETRPEPPMFCEEGRREKPFRIFRPVIELFFRPLASSPKDID